MDADDHTYALVANPHAGGGRGRRAALKLAERLRVSGHRATLQWTTARGGAEHLTRSALANGAGTVVVVGGDGSASEAVEAFLACAPAQRTPAARLALWPCGTGNDLARGLGLRGPGAWLALTGEHGLWLDAVRLELERPPAGTPARRHFINAADVGLGAEGARIASRLPTALGGTLSYLAAALGAIARHSPSPLRFRVDGGGWREESASLLAVANGAYFGGGMQVAPGARLDDGLLNLVLLRGTSRAALVTSLLPRVYGGRHLGHPAIWHGTATSLEVALGSRDLEVDGEFVRAGGGMAHFEVLPAAVRLASLPPAPAT